MGLGLVTCAVKKLTLEQEEIKIYLIRMSILSVSNFLCAQLLLSFQSEFFETCHNESP